MHPYTEILGAPGDGLGGVPWGRDIPDLTSPLPVGVQNIGLQLEGKETQYPMVGGGQFVCTWGQIRAGTPGLQSLCL